jgi:hypothetical protein
MDWFKHKTCSHEDPDISDAWDVFGDAGPVVFWTILEVFGKEFSHLKDEWLTLSIPYFERKLRRKWKKSEKILEFFEKRERIYFKKTVSDISITIPKFIAISSNWTVRPKDKPTEVTTEVTTDAPTAIEEEEKKKKKRIKNIKTEQVKPQRNFIPPQKEWIEKYCLDRKNGIDAQSFIDHYTNTKWRIGKPPGYPMTDWEASVRTWERNNKDRPIVNQSSVDAELAEWKKAVGRE